MSSVNRSGSIWPPEFPFRLALVGHLSDSDATFNPHKTRRRYMDERTRSAKQLQNAITWAAEGEFVRYHVEIICRDSGKSSRSISTSNPSAEHRRSACGC